MRLRSSGHAIACRGTVDPRISRRDLRRLGAAAVGSAAIARIVRACGQAAQAPASSAPVATASAKPTLAPASLNVQVGVQNVEFAGILAAEDQGYLKALALTETLLPYGPNVQPVTVIAGGSAPGGGVAGARTVLTTRALRISVVHT